MSLIYCIHCRFRAWQQPKGHFHPDLRFQGSSLDHRALVTPADPFQEAHCTSTVCWQLLACVLRSAPCGRGQNKNSWIKNDDGLRRCGSSLRRVRMRLAGRFYQVIRKVKSSGVLLVQILVFHPVGSPGVTRGQQGAHPRGLPVHTRGQISVLVMECWMKRRRCR